MKKCLSLLLLTIAGLLNTLQAQVSFSVSQKRVSPTEIDVTFKAKIAKGWHVYSTNIPDGGPTAARFGVDKADGAEPLGALKPGPGVKSMHDDVFEMQLSFFENTATFTQRIKLTKKDYKLKAYLEWGACNDQNCLPPSTTEVTVSGSDGPTGEAAKAAAAEMAHKTEQDPTMRTAGWVPPTIDTTALANAIDTAASPTTVAPADSSDIAQWYQSSIDQLKHWGEDGGTHNRTLWYIFLMGFVGGLITILTPCVWPIIPMTVSFFLHRNDDRRKAIRDAIIYGISIVVIYVSLGLIVTSLSSANTLNDLSTNAVFNIFLFLLLVVFAASFLGGFEITLPSSWNNKVNARASSASGFMGLFLMAFTLTLVSFSCTGPIIGFLLVEVSTAGGSILNPTIGMLGFAIALALPFTLFALFPTMLKKAPKSGGWMNVVKVVLGFIELAFALKFLSVADLAYGWHILDRETFLALWIAIFGLLGAYLFGWIKFPSDDDDTHTSVPRFFLGLGSLAFAIYMIPGLWGAPCKAISAFAPPMYTQDFNLDQVKVEAKFRDYEEGMAYAKKAGKPVLLDFTGFGCVNCRKMELAVWHDAKVRDIMNKDYVLISLYVDDKTRLPENIEVKQADGTTKILRTVGDKWSYLESTKFGAQTQPFYVPVDNEGKALNHSFSYKEDIPGYVKFLEEGLKNYREKK